jgi:hypothetical protein
LAIEPKGWAQSPRSLNSDIAVGPKGANITKLPKADHEAAEWQAAMKALKARESDREGLGNPRHQADDIFLAKMAGRVFLDAVWFPKIETRVGR